jgi:hypothetical protein
MTVEVRLLYRAAAEKLEKNQFKDAAELFRQAAIMEPPTAEEFANWSVAEDQDRLAFLRSVAETYPMSLACHTAMIAWLLRIGFTGQAVAYCTQVIDRTTDPAVALSLRRLRFRAATKGQRYPDFLSDFHSLWFREGAEEGIRRLRAALLTELAGITDPILLPPLAELRNDPHFPQPVQLFLARKVDELLALQQASGSGTSKESAEERAKQGSGVIDKDEAAP